MSILSYPRIHFRGTITLNAATANDDDVVVAIDRERVKLLPVLANRTDADALAWLTAGVPAISIINGSTFQYLRAGWNPFGDLTAQFVDVRVCSTIDPDGVRSSVDALVGSWLGLEGIPGRRRRSAFQAETVRSRPMRYRPLPAHPRGLPDRRYKPRPGSHLRQEGVRTLGLVP